MDFHPPPYRPNFRGTLAEKNENGLFQAAPGCCEHQGPISAASLETHRYAAAGEAVLHLTDAERAEVRDRVLGS